jgi:peptidoglycan/xylan/chitin deacetylase (PgdA/CDA1 family)
MKKLRIIATFLSILLWCNLSFADAVIIMYHRVGDSRYPTTNVTTQQFQEEMQWLHDQNYNVISLNDIVSALKNNQSLPQKTVGISFDDAYASIYDNALPILKQYKFPFTLFVAPQSVNQQNNGIMHWDQVREILKSGGSIGNHSYTHGHLATATMATLQKELTQAQQDIQKETDQTPTLFAYPFGEYSNLFSDVVSSMGFEAAFTQLSGAVNAQSDFYEIPRFPINEHYADFNRFKQSLNMLALNIADLNPSDTPMEKNPPTISFRVLNNGLQWKTLSCYAGNDSPVQVDTSQRPLVIVNVKMPFPEGRARINCTVQDNQGLWHWLGLLYIV